MSKRKFLVSVIGGHECDHKNTELAEKVGEIIAQEGATLVCGGREGIMKAVSRGECKALSGSTAFRHTVRCHTLRALYSVCLYAL